MNTITEINFSEAELLPQSESLSPLDISHHQFPRKFMGYDRGRVRAFLNQMANQLESLLHEQRALHGRVTDLEREIEGCRQAEDEIRRAVVAAERIGHDMREDATRQSELMLDQARSECEALEREAQARRTELEAAHQARMQDLETAFRARFADLEREHHHQTLQRDRAHAERTVYLERAFSERHTELSTRLSEVRTEYIQFVSQYRALIQSFTELSARHLPADHLSLPASSLPAVASSSELLFEIKEAQDGLNEPTLAADQRDLAGLELE